MPQKTARKKTTTKRTSARKATTHKSTKKLSLTQRIRGSISKKALIIGAGVIVLIGAGVGGYALWQNTNAGAAGGWTSIGTRSYSQWANGKKTGKTVTFRYDACKIAYAKLGYKVKGRAVVVSTNNTSTATFTASTRLPNGSGQVYGAETTIRTGAASTTGVTSAYITQSTGSFDVIVSAGTFQADAAQSIRKTVSSVTSC
jgi:hypothetical protein